MNGCEGGFYVVERNRSKLYGKRVELTFDLYWEDVRLFIPILISLIINMYIFISF